MFIHIIINYHNFDAMVSYGHDTVLDICYIL